MDIIVFPRMLIPLLVFDEHIINGINRALEDSKMLFLLAAKTYAGVNQPGKHGLYITT